MAQSEEVRNPVGLAMKRVPFAPQLEDADLLPTSARPAPAARQTTVQGPTAGKQAAPTGIGDVERRRALLNLQREDENEVLRLQMRGTTPEQRREIAYGRQGRRGEISDLQSTFAPAPTKLPEATAGSLVDEQTSLYAQGVAEGDRRINDIQGRMRAAVDGGDYTPEGMKALQAELDDAVALRGRMEKMVGDAQKGALLRGGPGEAVPRANEARARQYDQRVLEREARAKNAENVATRLLEEEEGVRDIGRAGVKSTVAQIEATGEKATREAIGTGSAQLEDEVKETSLKVAKARLERELTNVKIDAPRVNTLIDDTVRQLSDLSGKVPEHQDARQVDFLRSNVDRLAREFQTLEPNARREYGEALRRAIQSSDIQTAPGNMARIWNAVGEILDPSGLLVGGGMEAYDEEGLLEVVNKATDQLLKLMNE